MSWDTRKAKLCFSQPELAPLSEEVRADCPDLQRIYTSLPPLETAESAEPPLPDVAPDTFAAILYTSGTTARPKGSCTPTFRSPVPPS